jgi:hypothetical protein
VRGAYGLGLVCWLNSLEVHGSLYIKGWKYVPAYKQKHQYSHLLPLRNRPALTLCYPSTNAYPYPPPTAHRCTHAILTRTSRAPIPDKQPRRNPACHRRTAELSLLVPECLSYSPYLFAPRWLLTNLLKSPGAPVPRITSLNPSTADLTMQ